MARSRNQLFSLDELHAAAALVYRSMPPTPQYCWPLLRNATGCEVWVKHENHTPIGAFKIRGGLVYVDGLLKGRERLKGLVTATRGNHGQSIALAGARAKLPVTILVPHENSREKNEAMRAFGATVVEHGVDFDEARIEAGRLAQAEALHFVPSFHPDLVRGVATGALELFSAIASIDTLYVPIGMGSGICAAIAVRDLMGLATEIVGVVAENAPAMALSFEAGHPVPTNSARTFADGMATREPQAEPLGRIIDGAARIVRVTEEEIAAAMRLCYETSHNIAEGAGAAGLAALLSEKARNHGKKVAVILSGSNIDRPWFSQVLAGETPRV